MIYLIGCLLGGIGLAVCVFALFEFSARQADDDAEDEHPQGIGAGERSRFPWESARG